MKKKFLNRQLKDFILMNNLLQLVTKHSNFQKILMKKIRQECVIPLQRQESQKEWYIHIVVYSFIVWHEVWHILKEFQTQTDSCKLSLRSMSMHGGCHVLRQC